MTEKIDIDYSIKDIKITLTKYETHLLHLGFYDTTSVTKKA